MGRPLARDCAGSALGAALVLAFVALPGRAGALEPKVHGGKGVLRITGEAPRYHLIEPGNPVTLSLKGSGTLALKVRAVQSSGGTGPLGMLHVAVDGADTTLVSVSAGPGGHFIGRRDLSAGPELDREVKLGEGQRAVTLTADNGPVAVVIDWQSDAASLLMATPLVADNTLTATPLTGAQTTPDAAQETTLKPPPPVVEPLVPLTVDATTPHHATWPYVVLAGALATGFAGAVVWGVAANTDSSYNNAQEGPGRNGKLSTANNELHASMVLAGVAIGLAAAGTVGLIFQ